MFLKTVFPPLLQQVVSLHVSIIQRQRTVNMQMCYLFILKSEYFK